MAYQREPMTCRCKRYVWQNDEPEWARWLDTNTQYRYSDLTCPDCKTKCGKNGAISYTDGRMVMVSLPYDNRDFYSRLTTMTMKLPDGCVVLDAQRGLVSIDIKPHKYDGWKASDAMKDMLNTCITQKETSVKMLSVEECKQKLNEAVKNKVIRKWKFFPNSRNDFWKAYGIEITYMDGATRSFTGNTNAHAHNQAVEYVAFITPKEKKVNRYSYDECFRIMRKAKKEGIIRGWGFCRNNSNVEPQPATWVERDGLVGTKRFTDDGTKGDIGVLNEVVSYTNQLSKEHALKNCKPATKNMTEEQLTQEIINTKYALRDGTVPNTSLVTYYLCNRICGTLAPISWQSGETRHDFLAKCVDHIRKQK